MCLTTEKNVFNIVLSCCDKLQFEAEVEIMLLEVVMNHFQGGETLLSVWMWMLTGLK